VSPNVPKVFLAFLVLTATAISAGAQGSAWTTYRNERFGFSLQYPADVFETERTSEAGDGQVFVGMHGHGRLLVGAFVNDARYSLESYRRFIAKQSYSGFDISYAPRGQTWFVLSGERDGSVFYEKVMFICAGAVINSFVLMYPTDSKSQFDPIVEGIERTFRPGHDCERSARR
jgi:hypothetical protein